MLGRPPRATLTDAPLPYTPLFRSPAPRPRASWAGRASTPRSCHRRPVPKFGLVPRLGRADPIEPLDRLNDVVVAQVERRQPEAQHVGGAEVGDDVQFLERLDDLIPPGMGISDLAAPARRVALADQREAVAEIGRAHV